MRAFPVALTTATDRAKRTYRSREQRQAMVAPLLELIAVHGPLPGHIKEGFASMCGVSEKTIERALAESRNEPPEKRAWQVPDHVLVRIAEYGGNIRAAWEDLRDEGHDLPSYPTLCRAIDARDPSLKELLRDGTAEMHRFLLTGERTYTRRNELWYTDATSIPIACRDGQRRIDRLTLVSYVDAYSRYVLAHRLIVGAEDAESAGHTLLAALLGRTFKLEELEGTETLRCIERAERLGGPLAALRDGLTDQRRSMLLHVGGRPERLQSDNGAPFASKEYAAITNRFLRGAHGFGRPHVPSDQGLQERFHRTLKARLMPIPGNTRGQLIGPADDPTRRPISVPEFRHLPSLEGVQAAVDGAIWDYNTEHVVRTTGLTPLAAYLLDETPIIPVPPTIVWPWMTVTGNRTVDPRGVHVRRRYWCSDALVHHIGREVEVRSLPGQPGRVFVADPHGGPPIEVEPNAALMRTEEGRARKLAANRSKARFIRGLMLAAKREKDAWAAEVADELEELDPVPSVPESRTERAKRASRTRADSGRALRRTFDVGALAGGGR